MGTNQSTDGQLGTGQHHDDVPYTSYSVDRVATREYSQISGKTSSPAKLAPRYKARSATGSPAHSIVVVTEGAAPNEDVILASELQKIRDIPTFMPLIKGPPAISSIDEAKTVEKLDHRQLLVLCMRYQQHLKQCSEAVSFDQNVLTSRVKEVDIESSTMANLLFERQRKYAKFAEQIQKINEMSFTLQKVTKSVNQLIPMMERLNSVLPAEERLDAFVMRRGGAVNR